MKAETEYIYDIPKFTKKASIDNTKELLKRIGFNEASHKIIHVAGTNGKGSVCSYIAGTLIKTGHKTGLFTSPHLVRINERIMINGCEVSDGDFEAAFAKVRQISEEMVRDGLVHPSFFEFLFGIAMYIYEKEQVEYIVLETGLGGRLDATNAITRPVLTVITSIGLDHTDILGNTYGEIAFEKAGIMKKGVPVVFAYSNEKVCEVLTEHAGETGAPAYVVSPEDIFDVNVSDKHIDFSLANSYYDSKRFTVNSRGIYQTENAALAAVAMKVAGLASYEEIYEGIALTKWTARMQEVCDRVVIDGAHNDDGIDRFLESVRLDGYHRRILLFSAVKDKHYEGMITKLCESNLFDTIVTGCIDDARGLTKELLEEAFGRHPMQKVIYGDTVKDAYETANDLKGDRDILYVAGSLYLAGEVLGSIHGNEEN